MHGWTPYTIGDVCTVIAGQSPAGKFYNDTGDGLPFYQGKKDFGSKHIQAPTKWTTHVTKEAENGDVLMSVRAPVGPINFATEKICIGRGLAAIRANEHIDRDFLFYGLLYRQPEINGNEGAVFASINKKQIEDIPFPLPPLSEQRRIVGILDEAFAGIDKIIANTEQNLSNARELFESYLNNAFTQKSDGWVEKKLGELCDVIGGGTPTKSNADFYAGDIPWATVRDMAQDVIVDTEHKITEEAVASSSTNVIPGDNVVIATRVGLGKVCFVENATAINQDLRGIIPRDPATIDTRFLFWWFKSIASHIVAAGTGATVQGVKLPFVKSLQFPLPPLPEQTQMVDQLDQLSSATRNLEAIYQQKLDALNELKQSILHKAFNGDLPGGNAAAKSRHL